MNGTTSNYTVTGAQIIVETLFAVLALGSIILFGLRYASVFGSEFQKLALLLDYFVCILFATKAVWDLWRAPDKRRWLKWGWADFAASVPEVEALRALRLLRLLLIIRVMRSTTQSVHSIATYFNLGRTRAVVATVFSLIVVSLVMSSFLILGAEGSHPEANIRTAENALLWAVATLFGAEPVYFGDHYPVTMGGRLISLWLVIVSLGLIGSLAGIISAWIEEEPES
ncbi:MAG: ion transporter [Halieaceae bacterium]|nr:ion transporter [Halieaceae bacterium]